MSRLTVAAVSYTADFETAALRAPNPDSTMCGRAGHCKSAHYERSRPAAWSPNGRPLAPPAVRLAELSGSKSMTPAHAALEVPLHDQRLVRSGHQSATEPPLKLFVLLLAVECLASV